MKAKVGQFPEPDISSRVYRDNSTFRMIFYTPTLGLLQFHDVEMQFLVILVILIYKNVRDFKAK